MTISWWRFSQPAKIVSRKVSALGPEPMPAVVADYYCFYAAARLRTRGSAIGQTPRRATLSS